MLDISENIIEGLIEEEKPIEGINELGFYRPAEKLGKSLHIKDIRINTAILEVIGSMPLDDDEKSNVFVLGINCHQHFKLRRTLGFYCRRQANNQVLNMCKCSNAPAKRSLSLGTFFSPRKRVISSSVSLLNDRLTFLLVLNISYFFTMSSSSVAQIERTSMLANARPVYVDKFSSLLKDLIMS
ncbi:hypothetical protein BD560DRAFT_472493 [Blakeslea trispora]|nr:hypothetical protein BD560DRAFT_472493 [Blakeslea trispora]